MTLVCDSNVLIAALNERDRDHERCAELLTRNTPTTIPAPVLVEVDWVTRTRGARGAIDALLTSIDRGDVLVVNLDAADYRRVRTLMRTYADLPLELVDAAVIAIAERLEEDTIATLDRHHFSVVRPIHIPSFTLVP